MPAPPADLRDRVLPVVEDGGPWTRMHSAKNNPLFFGKTGSNRFDDPEGEYGVLYAAGDAFGAFLESFGRRPGRNVVSWEKLRMRPLALVRARQPLRLVDLTGPGLARIGATAAISTDDYREAQIWSRALHEHPEAPDGLRYRLKHDPSRIGAALFERVGETALEIQPHSALVAPDNRKLLAAILEEYHFGLVETPPRY